MMRPAADAAPVPGEEQPEEAALEAEEAADRGNRSGEPVRAIPTAENVSRPGYRFDAQLTTHSTR